MKSFHHHLFSVAKLLSAGLINRAQLAGFVIQDNCEAFQQFEVVVNSMATKRFSAMNLKASVTAG